ncbi:MAG: leucyl aminopeptidase, partial [Caulobacteraceae bacterium]
MKIVFVPQDAAAGADAAEVVLAFEGGALSPTAEALDKTLKGQIRRAIAASPFFGEAGQRVELLAPNGSEALRVMVVAAGRKDAFDPQAAETAAAHAFQALAGSGAQKIVLRLGGVDAETAARAALGASLAAYRFDKHRTTEKPEKKPSVSRLEVAVAEPKAAQKAFEAQKGLVEAVSWARDLVTEPSNLLYPEEFARRAKKLADLGVEVEILGEKEMKKLGMGALLGVGQGSVRESQLAILQWRGAKDPQEAPIAFVGKGVCFDSGGISIKPAAGMEEMVTDMGGAAAAAGALRALAARKAKVNAVAILGLVENMPGGAAQRPGDVVKTMSGQTIEVINTDAEGRLVLSDALWYCQQRFSPRVMIDLATLTGAIVVALGKDVAGMFCNNDELAGNLAAAAKETGEALWRMPLQASYEKTLDSHIADIRNT